MTASSQPRATYRTVFRVREFRLLFLGFGLQIVGDSVQMLALAVLIYSSTRSPLLAALAYVANFLPYLIGGTLLLSMTDSWRPRRLMVAYDVTRMLVVIVLALNVLPPIAAIAVVVAAGTFAPAAGAVRTALLPELLQGDNYVLGRSLFTVLSGSGQVLGAGLGGLLLAGIGAQGALWLAAGACAVRAAVTRFGLPDWAARANRRDRVLGAVRQTMRVNRQLLADRRLRGLYLAQWLPGGLMVGAEGVVVPYVTGLGAPAAAGMLLMSAAAGMLLGDAVVGRLVTPRGRERATPWLAAVLGIGPLLFLLRPGVLGAAVLFAVTTAGFAYHLGLAQRFVDAVPDAARGQAFGLLMTGTMTTQAVTMAAAGALAEVLAPSIVIAVAGATSLVATAALRRQLTPAPQPEARTRPQPVPGPAG